MKMHWIQHVHFEGLGYIEQIALREKYEISVTRLYEEKVSFPDVKEFDLLVIMGGPMGVYDTDLYKWLTVEKTFIKNVIENGKKVIGICLGAQLIADVLGGTVYKNENKEIGWHRITPDKDYKGKLSGSFDLSPEVFHWHGDTFTIPNGSDRVCSSEGCANQAFDYCGRVFGLQFHLETTESSAIELINNCRDDLKISGKFIQNDKYIMQDPARFVKISEILEDVFLKIVR